MTVEARSISQIESTIKADIGARLGQAVPLLPKAFTNVIAKVFAAIFVVLYKYLSFGILQIFVRHASAAPTGLNGKMVIPLYEWGQLLGEGLPLGGQRAEHTTSLAVLTTGGTLPQGTVFLRKVTGVLYESTAPVALSSSSVVVTVRAYSDQVDRAGFGSLGNLVAGDELELANAPAAVSSRATVIGRTVDGADPEDVETSYRDRVVFAIARPKQGGAESDYLSWARQVPGILGAWPYRGTTPNRVTIYVLATAESSGSADGVPTGPQLTAVANSIQFDGEGLRKRRPMSSLVTVLGITRHGLTVRVAGLDAPDMPATQTAIQAACDQYLRQRRPWISGLDVLPVRHQASRAGLGGVVQSVVAANKGTFQSIRLFDGPTELDVYTLAPGELCKLTAITWT